MEGHLLSISQPVAVTVRLLIPYEGSCGTKFWFHCQHKCCLTELWQVGNAGHKVNGMHWARRSGKGGGPARTDLVGIMNMERWEHQSMELEDRGRSSVWIAVKQFLRSLDEAVPTQLQRERKKKI